METLPPEQSLDRDVTEADEALSLLLPRWITPALIQRTLNVWQKRCVNRLTQADAIAMLMNVARLAGVLQK
jgi:hypothetical protein